MQKKSITTILNLYCSHAFSARCTEILMNVIKTIIVIFGDTNTKLENYMKLVKVLFCVLKDGGFQISFRNAFIFIIS